MRHVVVLACVIALPAVAHADDEPKSVDTAFRITEYGGIAGIALTIGGAVWVSNVSGHESPDHLIPPDIVTGIGVTTMFLAPTFGHWYAGRIWTRGLTLRVVGGAVGVGGGFLALLGGYGDNTGVFWGGAAIVAAGSGLVIAGIIDDLRTMRGSVERSNSKRRPPTIAPMVLRPPSGPVMGIGISGSF